MAGSKSGNAESGAGHVVERRKPMGKIVVLGQLTACPAEVFGPKASRLHDLLLRGSPTVGGFALAAEEHVRHLKRNNLSPEATCDEVEQTSLEMHLARELGYAAVGLGGRLAVRSSALNEDGPSQSQAGKYLTLLNVEPNGLMEAIVKVWASAHSPRLPAGQKFVPMGIIVQPMLVADAYGVVAGANPLTGGTSAVIEIGAMPMTVTSGQAVDERYEVRHDLTVDPEPTADSLASLKALRSAATIAWKMRDDEHQEFELEFGCTDEGIMILQARPIGIPETKATLDPPPPPGNWILDPVHYPRPLTPLFESIFAPLVSKVSGEVFAEYGVFARSIELKSIYGWPYVRVVPLSDIAAPSLPGALIGLATRVHPQLRDRTSASEFALTRNLPAKHVADWQQTVAPTALAFLSNLSDQRIQSFSNDKLRGSLTVALEQLELVMVSNYQTDFAHLIPLARFVNMMRHHHGWDDATSLVLVHSGADSRALYPAAMENLASEFAQNDSVEERLRSVGSGGLDWVAGSDENARRVWEDHRKRWSFTLLGYDLDEPTLGELPALERRTLIAILDGARERPRKALGDSTALSNSERAQLIDAQKWFHIREQGESVKAGVLGAIRVLALEIGRRLEVASVVPHAQTALYFTIDELRSACLDATAVAGSIPSDRENERKRRSAETPEREFGRPTKRDPDLRWLPKASRDVHSAVMLLGQNEILPSIIGAVDTLLGRAASPGTHTGKVRIIRDASQLSGVEDGDVIVAASASSTWSSGFWVAGALVTEAGGLLSHSAIVAREMGIPAVIGVEAATTKLHDGDLITVDGAAGRIIRRLSAGTDGPIEE
ncbi:PEP-utilizing enzyme [Streptomyces sp. SID13031]|uniref:PEP-utilizing enzyme n=1 Tax=Streptomyces sp. SID13031 TaxID=2706046 RepID=UPI0013C81D0F|nr:PEP-utilizing enzyme [Streptomyces sp. SID13031]NEA37478.1 hypothetical protein [Streptomyces sp. SID13031]